MYEKELLEQPVKESFARKFYSSELSHLNFETIHEFVSELRELARNHRNVFVEEQFRELKEKDSYLRKLSDLEF